MTLWIRNSAGKHAEIELKIDDVLALRDYCQYILTETGRERYAQVAVPR